MKESEGYAGAIEVDPEPMASSHQIKRLFYGFSLRRIWLFRRLIQQLFLWRLRVRDPEVVILGMDSMVLDNCGAEKRKGVEPTYAGTEGFHPFQVTWDRFIADAILRGGSKHSNDGDTAIEAIRHLTGKIRKVLGEEVPIIVRMDAGFFDKEVYQACEELGIGYISSGRLLEEIKARSEHRPSSDWALYQNGSQEWAYHERGDRRGTWSRFRRMTYTRVRCEDGQRKFDFARKDTIIYTNLGLGGLIDRRLGKAGKESLLETPSLLELHHGRGRDGLVHRALKDPQAERMPSRGMAFYSAMLVAFNLYETFKEDGFEANEENEFSQPKIGARIPLSSYARRLRREVIDIVGKLVRTAGRTIPKVTEATARRLGLEELFRQVANPPRFRWTCSGGPERSPFNIQKGRDKGQEESCTYVGHVGPSWTKNRPDTASPSLRNRPETSRSGLEPRREFSNRLGDYLKTENHSI